MKLAFTIAAAAAAVAFTSLSSPTPAAAIGCYPNGTLTLFAVPVCPPTNTHNGGGSSAGPYVIGCIAGSAIGLITASIAKGNAYGYPLRWMSQVEYEAYVRTRNKQADLTTQEAQLIAFTCGLGAFPVIAAYQTSN
jgi:hypothetical protein